MRPGYYAGLLPQQLTRATLDQDGGRQQRKRREETRDERGIEEDKRLEKERERERETRETTLIDAALFSIMYIVFLILQKQSTYLFVLQQPFSVLQVKKTECHRARAKERWLQNCQKVKKKKKEKKTSVGPWESG